MVEQTCRSCAYFRQHYTFNERKIFRVYCGHCTCSKNKTKRPDAKACDKYIQAEPDETAFVSKEFLSKALLTYVLNLELLPEIYDSEA